MIIKINDWNKVSVNMETDRSRLVVGFDNENSENSQFEELTKTTSFLSIGMLGLLLFLGFLVRLSIPCLTLFGLYKFIQFLIV